MARKEDSEKDTQSKILLEQLNTFTVGPPYGVTGDSVPDTVFEVGDFDRIRNQLNLQLTNMEALNMLNTIGQITNTQGTGPIPNTQVIKTATVTDSSVTATIFRPDPGQVWLWQDWDASVSNGGGANINHYTYVTDGSNTCYIYFNQTTSTTPKDAQPNSVIYVTHDVYAGVQSNIGSISGASVVWKGVFIRVR